MAAFFAAYNSPGCSPEHMIAEWRAFCEKGAQRGAKKGSKPPQERANEVCAVCQERPTAEGFIKRTWEDNKQTIHTLAILIEGMVLGL